MSCRTTSSSFSALLVSPQGSRWSLQCQLIRFESEIVFFQAPRSSVNQDCFRVRVKDGMSVSVVGSHQPDSIKEASNSLNAVGDNSFAVRLDIGGITGRGSAAGEPTLP